MIAGRFGARAQLFSAAVLFGLMAVFARLASQAEDGFGSGQNVLVRFAVGTLFCLAAFATRPGTIRPVRKRLLLTRGILGSVAVLLYFIALARIPAGEATLLNCLYPVLTTVFAVFTLGERPTAHLAFALVITSVGVLLVLGVAAGGLHLGTGEVAGFGSAVLSAGAVLSIRALRGTDNAPTIFFAFCLGGLLISLPFAAGSWHHSPAAWGWAIGTGVVSIGAQLLMTHALGLLTIPEAAIWQQLTPVTSYLWAIPFLGESVTGSAAAGVAMVVVGVAWGAALGGARRASPSG